MLSQLGINMFRVLLMVVGLGAVLAQHRGGMPKCGRIMHGGLECCKKDMPSPHMPPSDDIKECLTIPKKHPPSCELDICIAQKRGLGKADGSIDKEAFEKDIETKFKDDPDLSSNVIANCINGDLSKFGPADICDLMKLRLCMDVEVIKSCDEWKDEGDCSGMQDLAEECIKEFS